MAIISAQPQNVKSKQAKTSLPFCYTNHKEPSPLDRFLGTAYKKHGRTLRKSTRTIGIALFYTLREGPLILNLSQLARDTNYSATTVSRAIKYFSRFGKVQRINERRTGKRRPCEYKLHDTFTEKQEHAKPQEKGRCGVSHPYTRDSKEETKPTKGLCPSFSIDSFKNTPKSQQLNQADKRRLSFFARRSCQSEVVSAVLSVLWQRDAVAGVWLEAIRGLQGVMIDAQPEELLWRSRKAVSGLIGGLDREGFEAIMLDQPLNEEEATRREVAEIDRRLRGLTKWGARRSCTSWFVEKRAELEKQKYNVVPCAVSVDNFFTTVSEPKPQARRPRGRLFHVSEHYTAKRQPLEGEDLERKKQAARERLKEEPLRLTKA